MNDRQREYERLIAPIEGRMMRAVWRVTGNAEDAEDALQEALLAIWKRWERIVEHPNPEALVLHICINSAHDLLRRRVRQGKWTAAGAETKNIADPAASAADGMLAAEQRSQVMRAVGVLPKTQARAILMHAVEEVPYDQIAGALGCGEATVRKHVWRARHKLRALLSRWMPGVRREETSHA